jgi:PAS domain S-box-containing protein
MISDKTPRLWQRWADRLTRPHPGIKSAHDRQQARLLATLLLTLLFIFVALAPLWLINSPDFIQAPVSLAGGLLMTLATAYAVSRTRYYRGGAVLFIATILVLVFLILLYSPGPLVLRMLALKAFIVAMMISVLFLRRSFTALLFLFCVMVISSFFWSNVPFSFTYSYLAIFVMVSGLAVVNWAVWNRYKQELLASEERYAALFEQSHDAVFLLDLQSRHIAINRRATELLGYSLEELRGRSIEDISAETAASMDVLGKLLAGEHVPVYERLFRRKDGSVVPVEIKAELVRDEEGNPRHIQSVVRDITERKAQEQELRQSEARQRALLDAIPDLMFRAHRDGTYLDYHALNSNQLLLTPDQFLGRKIIDVLPPDLAQTSMNYIDQALRTGKLVQYEYSLVFDDRPLYFEARMIPSGPDEILTIVRDITRQKEMQAQALELTLEKERADLLRQFVQNASHELRTPLTSINTNLYLISKVADEKTREEYVERSQKQIMRLTHLIDMILSMTRLDSGIPFVFEQTDINEIVGQLVTGSEAIFSEKGGVIQFTPDPTLPKWRVDGGWLQQAIRHLLDNAIRFSPNGGLIALRTYRQADEVVIEIDDNGVGISEELLPRIFERFWRYDKAHSTPGFGLGLPIVQKIVAYHNGRIEVESEVGQGSQFRILLPHHANSDS